MNSGTFRTNQHYRSFISALFGFGTDVPKEKSAVKTQGLIIDENGSISINYADPKVLREIEIQMREIQNIPLSKDIKVDPEEAEV